MSRISKLAFALAALALSSAAEARSDQYTTNRSPVRWTRRAVTFVIDNSLRDHETLPDPAEVVRRAVAAWTALPNLPSFDVRGGSLGPLGYDVARRQNNVSGIALYRSEFPNRTTRPVLALTIATRNAETGEILDADVIVDAEHNRFATLPAAGMLGMPSAPYDYQSVFTHELGHVLGLSEDPDSAQAVMYPSSRPGEVNKRALSPEDVASIQEVYDHPGTGEDPFEALQAGGCGGAHVHPRGAPLGARAVAYVALGLLALGCARARWRKGWVFAVGGILLAVGAPEPSSEAPPVGLVTSARSHVEGGLIVTRATILTGGVVREVRAYGGRVGELEQEVYHGAAGQDLRPGATVDPRTYGVE